MAGLAPTFPEEYVLAADTARIRQSFHLHNGQRNTHLLIPYIEDRHENVKRWTQVLETTDVPTKALTTACVARTPLTARRP
jgi:hypothetical protein